MYRCSKCGQPKRGHICPYKAKTMEVIDLCLSDDDAGASVPRVSKSTEGAIDPAATLLCSK